MPIDFYAGIWLCVGFSVAGLLMALSVYFSDWRKQRKRKRQGKRIKRYTRPRLWLAWRTSLGWGIKKRRPR